MIAIINQIFEIEQKLKAKGETIADRNIKRLYHEFETSGYRVTDPIGRKYQETDTDIEATLSGNLHGALNITRVLKPVIYQVHGDSLTLVQQGIVIVEGAQ